MKTFLIEVFMGSMYFTCVKDGFLEIYIVDNKTKRWIRKRVFQKNKACQNFRKTNIFYPLIRTGTYAYQRVRNVRFSENLACFIFLKHPFWDSPFWFITDDISPFETASTWNGLTKGDTSLHFQEPINPFFPKAPLSPEKTGGRERVHWELMG